MTSNGGLYKCKLDEATRKKAEQELYEDPKNRQGAIDTFRDWIKQQKHIKCPTDDVFLLGFLRGKHFSQLEARQSLELFMKQRQKYSSWMLNIDPTEKDIVDLMKSPVMVLLPGRDKEGRKVVIFKLGEMDMGNKTKLAALFRLFPMISYYNYLCDEMTQVHGTVYMLDFTGHTMVNELKVPMDDKKKFTTIMQKTFPARVKGFHFYNAGSMIEFVMGIIGRFFTEKLKKRITFHNHGLETVYDAIPLEILPDQYLPDDYTGPSAGPMDQVIAQMKAEFLKPEIRERIKYLSSDQFTIKMEDKDTDVPVASFRKLNVD